MNLFASNGFAVDEGKIWFVPYSDSLLCGYSLETKKIEFVRKIPDLNRAPGKYRDVIVFDNKAYLIPSNSNNLSVYDFEKDEFTNIVVSDGKSDNNFFSAHICDNYLYVFPGKKKNVIKISLSYYSVQQIQIPEKYTQDNNSMAFFQFSSCLIGKNVVLLPLNKKELLFFDVENEKWSDYKLEGEGCFGTVTQLDEKKLLITDDKGNVLYFDILTKDFKIVSNTNKNFISSRYISQMPCFSDALVLDSNVYLFPSLANAVVKTSIDSEELSICDWTNDYIKDAENSRTPLLSKIKNYKDKLYGFCVSKQELIEIDPSKKTIVSLPVDFSDECIDHLNDYINSICRKDVILEGKTICGDLGNYLSALLSDYEDT